MEVICFIYETLYVTIVCFKTENYALFISIDFRDYNYIDFYVGNCVYLGLFVL